MNTKQQYLTPTTESLQLMQESVICGSYDEVDATELLLPMELEVGFEIII